MKQELKENYLKKISDLIEEGPLVTQMERSSDVIGLFLVDDEKYAKWRIDIINILNLLKLEEYKKEFEEVAKQYNVRGKLAIGILRSLRENLENGFFEELETQVQISTYADFLDLADQYLSAGNKDFAAVAVSVALEDGMKKIARKNGLTVTSKDDVGTLNPKLVDAKVYNQLKQRKVESWKKLRNHSLHAEWSEFSDTDVSEMIQGVGNFLGEYYV